jgi:signal transduction histidine kinase|tara:strand:+ start:385 stop:651 length:267 start_codon:yes stop_codon:yes gene_type:complete
MKKIELQELVKEEMRKILQEEKLRIAEDNIDHLAQAFFSMGFLASYSDKMDLSHVKEMANELKSDEDKEKARKALSRGATVLGVIDDD